MDLTIKQKKFCNEYIIDFNGTQAAIRAGYSKKTAYSIASENLKKPEVQAFLQNLIAERNKSIGITQEEVVNKIIDVVDVCMQKVVDTDRGGNSIVKLLDVAGANKALDMLMRHTGGYDLDNKQKQEPLTINIMPNYI